MTNCKTRETMTLTVNLISCIYLFHDVKENTFPDNIKQLAWFQDSSERAYSSIEGSPITKSPVFTRFQEVLSSTIVGLLKENPMTFKNVARIDVSVFKELKDGWTIFQDFQHLAFKFFLLIDPQFMWSFLLNNDIRINENNEMQMCKCDTEQWWTS